MAPLSANGLALLTEGQAEGWDAVALVRYLRRSTFREMGADPDYQLACKIGASAIENIVLQPLKHIEGLV